jgi:hypothetical protein
VSGIDVVSGMLPMPNPTPVKPPKIPVDPKAGTGGTPRKLIVQRKLR